MSVPPLTRRITLRRFIWPTLAATIAIGLALGSIGQGLLVGRPSTDPVRIGSETVASESGASPVRPRPLTPPRQQVPDREDTQPSRPQRDPRGRQTGGPAAARQTGDLPLVARYQVSARTGAADPRYAFIPSEDWRSAWTSHADSGVRAVVDSGGVTLQAGADDWQIALTGWTGGAWVDAPIQVAANRVAVSSGDVTAWLVNGPLGIQQGWTVAAPAGDQIRLNFATSGTLQPAIDETGRGLRLVDAAGSGRLAFSGLLAFDAAGRDLAARFEARAGGIGITVDAAGAEYPVTIDPYYSSVLLTQSAPADYDLLGQYPAISADGSIVAVGADYGPGGNRRGAIYLFQRNGSSWASMTDLAVLSASDSIDNDSLSTVAISRDGSLVVAGARGADLGGTDRGAVYVFQRSGATWTSMTESAKLTAATGIDSLWLGTGVAISADGSTIVASAGGDWSQLGAILGEKSVYVFERPAGGWANGNEVARLRATNVQREGFGWPVAVSGNGATVIAGDWDFDHSGYTNNGAVFVFERPAGGWASTPNVISQTAILTATDGLKSSWLGDSVAISDDGSIIASGADGTSLEWDGTRYADAGAIYVFERPGVTWQDTT